MYMKIRSLHLKFLLLAFLTGCVEDDIVKTENTTVYFEVNHSNDAWNTQRKGFVIDEAGNVRIYENPVKWIEADSSKGMLTIADIQENISKTVLSDKKVDAATLKAYTEKIPLISMEEYTKRIPGGTDMGITSYYAYRFDSKKQVYIPILLSETGDWKMQNKDQSAIEISGWLTGIVSELY